MTHLPLFAVPLVLLAVVLGALLAWPRAPRWMGDYGVEWLFRLASEPKRLWKRYLVGNPQFVVSVLRNHGH